MRDRGWTSPTSPPSERQTLHQFLEQAEQIRHTSQQLGMTKICQIKCRSGLWPVAVNQSGCEEDATQSEKTPNRGKGKRGGGGCSSSLPRILARDPTISRCVRPQAWGGEKECCGAALGPVARVLGEPTPSPPVTGLCAASLAAHCALQCERGFKLGYLSPGYCTRGPPMWWFTPRFGTPHGSAQHITLPLWPSPPLGYPGHCTRGPSMWSFAPGFSTLQGSNLTSKASRQAVQPRDQPQPNLRKLSKGGFAAPQPTWLSIIAPTQARTFAP